jgi:hypothetical protein
VNFEAVPVLLGFGDEEIKLTVGVLEAMLSTLEPPPLVISRRRAMKAGVAVQNITSRLSSPRHQQGTARPVARYFTGCAVNEFLFSLSRLALPLLAPFGVVQFLNLYL